MCHNSYLGYECREDFFVQYYDLGIYFGAPDICLDYVPHPRKASPYLSAYWEYWGKLPSHSFWVEKQPTDFLFAFVAR